MLKSAAFLLCVAFACAHPYSDTFTVKYNENSPVVTTNMGALKSGLFTSRLGKTIYGFLGIRYAKPPINERRFQPPVAAEKWEGVLNTTVDGPACPQTGKELLSEDCLSLNVYSPKLPNAAENPKRPVLAFFHQGDFCCGTASSDVLGPKYLVDEDIVLVTINYRLGILGFLSTGDKEAPGNNGLKDQVLALKWIKDNIAFFGGDPNAVTIAGHGAGAISVTLHLVSPLSKGLFHRAIAMSGSALGNLPLKTNGWDVARRLAKLIGCPDDTSTNLIKCLRERPFEEFLDAIPRMKEYGVANPHYVYLPVIEEVATEMQFLPAHPVQLILEDNFAKVPFVTGVTTDEFVNLAFDLFKEEKALYDLDKYFEKYAPIVFMYEREGENSKTISKELKKFYLDGKEIFNRTHLPVVVQMYADALSGFAVNRAAKLLADKSGKNVFYYRFNFNGRYSNFYIPESNNTDPYGVAHGDDLIYLFNNMRKSFEFKETDPEVQTVEKMTRLWSNFVKGGKPTPDASEKLDNVKWESFNKKSKKYLDIGNKLVLNENLNEKRYAEWEKLFPLSAHQGKEKHMG